MDLPILRGDCSACPVAPQLGGIPCAADVRRHFRFCSLAREDPAAYVPQIVRLSIADAAAGRVPKVDHPPPADPSQARTPHRGPLDPRKELVVARYREDIAWTAAVGFEVLVYNAGPPVAAPAPHVTVIDKPNLGREEHSYLTHIVTRYDDLAELTVFCQAHPWDHSPDFLARLRPRYDEPAPLATRYLEGHPGDEIKARDRIERLHGFEVRYGLATATGHGDEAVYYRPWLNRAVWPHLFACPEPDPWWFGYAATWAVPWWAIRRRPRPFWRWLKAEAEKTAGAKQSWTDPPYNPWMAEATWLYLWSDPAEYPHREECSLP